MIRFFKWMFSPTKKPIVETNDVYEKLLELEKRIIVLEEENVETTNVLYELMENIRALDSRIDIVTSENWNKGNV